MNSDVSQIHSNGELDATLVDRAAPPGSMRYFSLLFTPPEQRQVVAAMYVVDAELRDSALAAHDVAHARLQWWREEMDRLAAHKPQHPATRVLARAGGVASVDFKVLQEAVLAAMMDLACATFETEAELAQYFGRSSGVLMEIVARYLAAGEISEQALLAAQQCGQLVRHTEVLRDLRRDVHRGRLYLPLAALEQAQITHEMLEHSQWPDALIQLLQTRAHQQLIEFHAALDALTHAEKAALRPLIVAAQLHARLLTRIARQRFAQSRVRAELNSFDKLWTAWRAARAAR